MPPAEGRARSVQMEAVQSERAPVKFAVSFGSVRGLLQYSPHNVTYARRHGDTYTQAHTMRKLVPVTLRALLARINRKLKPEMKSLKTARGDRMRQDVGDFYIIDVRRNFVMASHVDPEEYGRDLGVLREYETVV